METNWAAEHLQTIRTLMERSAIYRRALAPIMIWCGVMGVAGGIAGWLFRIGTDYLFALFWNGVAVVALTGSFLLARRQALKDSEPFWSPPTRRVAQALSAPLTVGCLFSALTIFGPLVADQTVDVFPLAAIWAFIYGCALHSAGFFMPRGIKVFGWGFIVCGAALIAYELLAGKRASNFSPHAVMGGVFGASHLAYGVYLYFTEPRKNAT